MVQNCIEMCEDMGLAQRLWEHGVEIVNCSRETALTCYPRQSLEDFVCAGSAAS